MNRHIRRRRYHNIKNTGTLLQWGMKAVIVFLCVYIATRCINIITGDSAGKAAKVTVNNTTSVIANEIISNTSIVNQYMLYLENQGSITEEAKKQLLSSVVTDYMENSEYTLDTTDPGYEQVVDLVYKNINMETEQEVQTKEPATQKKTEKKDKKEQIIVPIPKATGKIYTKDNIGSFKNVINKFYTITSATAMYESDMPLDKALDKKFKIKGTNKKPQILIYHTHSQEGFCDSTSDESTTIIGVGEQLETVLEKQFGYNVIHDTSYYDIVNGKLDRNKAYDQSRAGVKKILDKYPSISMIIDIHRDGVNENTRLVTEVNGKKTAQIMMFNGMSRFKLTGDIDYLYNPYLFENLALTLQMKLKAETYYPGFTRRNYVNAYQYNLDISPQSMLIEVGAQTNTYMEARNAAEPLAVLIDMVLGKK